MKKVIFTPGTKMNVWSYLNDMQTYIYDNTYNLVDVFLQNAGVMCETISGVINPSDTSLKLVFGATVQVNNGTAIDPSGLLLYNTNGVTGALSPTTGIQYIYAAYDRVNNLSDTTRKIVGFLYNPSGTTTVATRNEAATTINFELRTTTSFAETALSGVLLGSGTWNGVDTWTTEADLRTPIRIKESLLPSGVFRKYGEWSNVGSIKTTRFGIQDDTEAYTYWINNSGIAASYEMSASGIKDAFDWRHVAGTETTFVESGLTAGGHTVLTDYNAISKGSGPGGSTLDASNELTRLFRHGIINLDGRTDGVNDQRLVTTLIPSPPGIPTTVSGQLIELSTDSTFSRDLNAALLNYNLKDLESVRKNEGKALVNTFYGEMQRVAAENSYSKMEGFFLYSGIVYLGNQTFSHPAHTYTLSGAAHAIASGGYGVTVSGLGFALPSGVNYYDDTPECFVYQINNTVNILNNSLDSIERDRLSAATSVLSKTSRLEIAPAHARKQYRCRLTWVAPGEVNSEEIKNYNLRIYKLNPSTQNAVVAEPTISVLEADFGKVIEMKDPDTYIRRKEYQTVSGHVEATWSGLLTEAGYNSTVVYCDEATEAAVQVGDYLVQSDGTDDQGTPYFVTKKHNISGLQLDRQFTYPLTTYDSFSVYRSALESTTTHIRYDFDIYGDQYYVAYIRAVTEYDIAGDWSTALRITTNDLTNAAGQTLGDIINVDETLIARTNEIKNTVFTQRINSQIAALQKSVEDTPERTAFDSLVVDVATLNAAS